MLGLEDNERYTLNYVDKWTALLLSLWYVVFLFQVPAKPNYSLALYYASDRPAKPGSLFAQFVDGSDMFRDARFKLIPSIVEVCYALTLKYA